MTRSRKWSHQYIVVQLLASGTASFSPEVTKCTMPYPEYCWNDVSESDVMRHLFGRLCMTKRTIRASAAETATATTKEVFMSTKLRAPMESQKRRQKRRRPKSSNGMTLHCPSEVIRATSLAVCFVCSLCHFTSLTLQHMNQCLLCVCCSLLNINLYISVYLTGLCLAI